MREQNTKSRTWIAVVATLLASMPALLIAAGAAESAKKPEVNYSVEKVLPLGGEGRWDYCVVDPAGKRLYVSRQTHVQVVNLDSGKVVADLKDTPGVHGVALDTAANRGFISNGQGNSVTVFDLKENKELGKVPVGQNPDAILFDPSSKRVFAFNGKSNDVTVIDAGAEPGAAAVAGHIPLEGKPEFGVADGHGHIYVNIEDKNAVTVIDAKEMKVTNVWKIDGGDEPSGLAIDVPGHRLFAGCGGNNVMAILDTETGKTLGTVPIGKGVDACDFDPEAHLAFASCGDGTLTIVKESGGKYEVAQTVQTRRGARTMALDQTTHKIYLPTAEFAESKPGERRPPMKPDSFMIVVVAPGPK